MKSNIKIFLIYNSHLRTCTCTDTIAVRSSSNKSTNNENFFLYLPYQKQGLILKQNAGFRPPFLIPFSKLSSPLLINSKIKRIMGIRGRMNGLIEGWNLQLLLDYLCRRFSLELGQKSSNWSSLIVGPNYSILFLVVKL